jgi:hypothetical protein
MANTFNIIGEELNRYLMHRLDKVRQLCRVLTVCESQPVDDR